MPRIDSPYFGRTHGRDRRPLAGMPVWPWIAIAALAGATLFSEVLAHDGSVQLSLPGVPCAGHGNVRTA